MKALIIDDERLARKELTTLLEAHPSIEIVGEAMNADEAEKLVEELNPDLQGRKSRWRLREIENIEGVCQN